MPPQRVDGVVDVGARAQRGDDDGHLVLRADLHVVLEAVVALVHDLVDRERRGRRLGMRLVVRGERLGDLGQPVVEQLGRARVERGHRADDAGLALRDHQLGVADDEQRRADDGQAQLLRAAGSGRWVRGMVVVSSESFQGHGQEACRRRRRWSRAVPGGLAQDVVAVEARGGDLGGHEGGVARRRRACRRPPAARAPSASRRRGCRPASGTAREPANTAFGLGLGVGRRRSRPASSEGLARGRQALARTACASCVRRGGQRLLGGLDARGDRLAPCVPPSRAVLRPTRSLAWIAVVPS